MKTSLQFFSALWIAVALMACSPDQDTLPGSGSSEEPSTDDSTVVTAGSPLYVIVKSKWETAPAGVNTVHGSCVIASTDAVGTAKSCTIDIPEAQLYFSDLSFVVGTSSSTTCTLVSFYPYWFKRSNSATFRGSGLSTDIDETDCSGSEKSACYGGAAEDILTTLGISFPAYKGTYFLSADAQEKTYTAKSLNSLAKNKATADLSFQSQNVNVTNNLVDRVTAIHTGGVDYAGAGAYSDYKVYCSDEYGAGKYQITVIINDDDNDGAGSDDYYDWD